MNAASIFGLNCRRLRQAFKAKLICPQPYLFRLNLRRFFTESAENNSLKRGLWMRTTRRCFLQQMTWLTAATAARGAHTMQPAGSAAQLLDSRALAHFVDPLPIPVLAKPNGLRPSPADPASQLPYYRIVMRQFQAKVQRDVPPSTFWGYNASCPGPIIEARADAPLLVEWANELPRQHFLPIDHTLHGAEA